MWLLLFPLQLCQTVTETTQGLFLKMRNYKQTKEYLWIIVLVKQLNYLFIFNYFFDLMWLSEAGRCSHTWRRRHTARPWCAVCRSGKSGGHKETSRDSYQNKTPSAGRHSHHTPIGKRKRRGRKGKGGNNEWENYRGENDPPPNQLTHPEACPDCVFLHLHFILFNFTSHSFSWCFYPKRFTMSAFKRLKR